MSKTLKVYIGTRYFTCFEEVYVIAKSEEEAEEKITHDQDMCLLEELSDPTLDDVIVREEVEIITIRQIEGPILDPELPRQIRLIPVEQPFSLKLPETCFFGYEVDEEIGSILPVATYYEKSVWELVPEEKEEENV
jgi:hypothetical protein